ncbi:MAG: hypothetical protein IJ087_17875 [Eggerthellaceae bacterium]|nr:hypothetical protein [Eggerthellaceae bacterium]
MATEERKLAERLVAYNAVGARITGLVGDICRMTGLAWNEVRDGLIDAVVSDVESMLKEGKR